MSFEKLLKVVNETTCWLVVIIFSFGLSYLAMTLSMVDYMFAGASSVLLLYIWFRIYWENQKLYK